MSVANLRQFAQNLRRLPTVAAQRITREAAPKLTALAKTDFAAGRTPYGDAWAPSVTGDKVDLRKTGAMVSKLFYVAIGTKLRVALGVPYAKYQIGKRAVFPTQGGELPAAYSATLAQIAIDVMREEMRLR